MRTLWLTLVAACGFAPGAASSDGGHPDSPAIDAAVDAMIDAPPMGANCFGHGFTVVCPKIVPTTAYSISATTMVDTSVGSSDCLELMPANDTVCVVGGTKVTISSFLKAHGSRPLVVLSLSTLDVISEIDVNSAKDSPGAGATGAGCTGTAPTLAGGGGYGGSFGGKGGNGGATVPPGGAAGDAFVPTALRGGCPGGAGKDPTGFVGLGGGAVALIAVDAISVLGTINASGTYGSGGVSGASGGNGGGAGGMIVFDSATLGVGAIAQIFANGGGGGEGTSSSGTTGGDGADPSSTTAGGHGGNGTSSGGNGGDGATLGTARDPVDAESGGDGTTTGGAGGGGGGFGVIKVVNAPMPAADELKRFSPRPS